MDSSDTLLTLHVYMFFFVQIIGDALNLVCLCVLDPHDWAVCSVPYRIWKVGVSIVPYRFVLSLSCVLNCKLALIPRGSA